MNVRNFFAELKRRNVYKVAITYAVVGWLVMQIAATVVPALHLSDAITSAVVLLVILGFPIALILAWAFELTPEGIKRAEDVAPTQSVMRRTGRKLTAVITLVAVLGAGLLVFRFTWPKRAVTPAPFAVANEKSIAVLPFENLSGNPENAYFAEGVQEEILTRLAKIAELKVISRTSTQRFKSAPGDLRDIAKQLGVANILEGSVQKAPDQVRVNVQLINAATDAHLWAETFDRKLTDIFAVESEIAKTVAETLRAKLTGSEQQAIAKRPTENPEAHELYLKGRFFWNKRTEADLRKALQYFEQAIERDPNYALAYAGIADSYDVLYFHSIKRISGAEVFPPAKAAALKALEIDETSAQAHAALAKALFEHYWDFPAAEKEFRRAIELNPNYATAHQWNCEFLSAVGRLDEAKVEIDRARELDPLSLIINAMGGLRYYWARQYPQAISALRATLTIDPNFPAAHSYLADVYDALGDYEKAIAEHQQADLLYGRETAESAARQAAALKEAYAKEGARGYWQKLLNLALQDVNAGDNYPYELATIYAHLGDKEKAFELLSKAYQERNEASSLLHLNHEAVWDDFRSDPRFQELVRRIGLRQ